MKLVFLTFLCWSATPSLSQADTRLVCYLDVKAINRTGDGAFSLDKIDPFLCTHLIYGFTSDMTTNSDSYGSTGIPHDKFLGPRVKNPTLKIMASIKSEDLKWDHNSMEKTVNTTVDYLKKYRFDGLDIYWNMSSSNIPTTPFFFALRNAFQKNGLLLSLALYTETTAEVTYFMEIIPNYIDFVSVLAYDLTRSTEQFWQADHPAPLYSTRSRNVDSLIHYFLEHDMPADKINLAIPMYGGSWTIPASSKLEPPLSATWGPANKHTGRLGQIPYFEICSNIRSSGWQVYGEDDNSTGPYAVSPEQMNNKFWVGYDDVDTVTRKSDYARNIRGLGGVTVWDLSQDDFRNICGKGPYQLTTAISRTLGIPRAPSLASSVRSGLSHIMFLAFAWGLYYRL
ncbi:probable chitinase 10 [Daphnia carinata]|uniref:probable chitinase 10 n=1 Tax=Daphnia carinata TaxID=120202 RepID=UPI00257F1BF8|nr:probable chitinase 10 [Daphnia carinata]